MPSTQGELGGVDTPISLKIDIVSYMHYLQNGKLTKVLASSVSGGNFPNSMFAVELKSRQSTEVAEQVSVLIDTLYCEKFGRVVSVHVDYSAAFLNYEFRTAMQKMNVECVYTRYPFFNEGQRIKEVMEIINRI